jgi:sarcosine oxidase subunit beta
VERGSRPDAIVIGAGVIGGAVAYELARRGWRTVSVDKAPAAGFGSTSASSAVVRFSYSTRSGVAAAWDGVHYWKRWPEYLDVLDERGHARFVQCGMAIFLTGPGGHAAKVRHLWDDLGVPYEFWDRDRLRARMPAFDLGVFGPPSRTDDEGFWEPPSGELLGALFSPDAGYVDDPQLAAHNLQRAAEARGAVFRFGAEVAGIVQSAERCAGVELSDGTIIHAPVVVNVAGPHSSHVNGLAGVRDSMNITTRAVRHETYHLTGPRDVDFTATGFCTADDDNGIYFRPQPGNHLLVGTTDPRCDPRVHVGPDDDLGEVTADGWETNTLRLSKRMPSVGVPLPHQKKGVVDRYDVSDDWIPIYDRTDLDGFYVAIGTSGNQFKNAGVAGHMMAELIEAVENGHDHDSDPLVVPGRFTGLDIDLATFHRNRDVDQRSSMSVHG